MDKKDEILSTDGSENELDPGIRELANLADKMGEDSSEPKYNEAGFDSEGFHKNGTRYDDEGYGADGFDEDGVDREGFDREGFGSDDRDREGFDREGYGKDGYDRKGFNRNGMNRYTKTKFDIFGRDAEGYDKRGFDGRGYDREGFNAFGWDNEGTNKETSTKYDVYGWSQYGKEHQETGTKYDPEGYDAQGFNESGLDREGYDRQGFNGEGYDRRGFNKLGINRETGTKYDLEGFDAREIDSYGFDKQGRRRNPEGKVVSYLRKYIDGYDIWGVDKDGYKEDGFNRFGRDREGYDRQGLDKDGYTREYNAKFNKYNVDENGYMKNGEMDPDVEFAMSFAESGIKDQNKYAAEKGLDEKDVREKIEMARKKCPNIDEIIKNLLLTGNKMRMAAISNDCEKFIDGSLDMYEFWDKHPRLTISDTLISFIDNPEKRKVFADKTIENVAMDSDNIENNLRIFGTSKYDVSGAIKGLEDFKKMYARFGIDGSPEQIQQKRENTKKIYDIIKYFGRYKNRNMDALLGSKMSFDNGQTWIEFSGEAIGRAMDALKEDKKLVCVQSVKDYIINQAKNPK